MKSLSPQLSKLVVQRGLIWGWAYLPGLASAQVHLYFDGRHVASEVTGLMLPPDIRQLCGTPPLNAAGFCFVLPAAARDGFDHDVQAALPQVDDGGLYGTVFSLVGSAVRGEVRQQGRQLVGTVWFSSPNPRLARLRITNERERLLYSKPLKPQRNVEPNGYPCTFTVPLGELAAESLLISCLGQTLRGSPLTPAEFVVGMMESCSPDAISGWAFNGTDPLKPIELALRVDGKIVHWFRPNMFRSDLPQGLSLPEEAMGITGFHFPPPKLLQDGFAHQVEVVCAATGQLLTQGQQRVHWANNGQQYKPQHSTPLSAATRPHFPVPDVSVIVLNRNGHRVLQEMLSSWERYSRTVPAELIVIDHASSDGSIALLKRWRKRLDLKIVALKQNDSFSASSNRGAKLARGKYLLFMNNDIQWLQDALPRMLESLQNPDVAIVGMKLLKVVGESQSGHHHASEVQHLGVRFTLNETGYWPYEITPEAGAHEEEFSPQYVPVVTGAALLCRKQEFDAVGGFHLDYFYGFEDVELCLRLANRLGKQVVCRNDCVALHHHGHTRLSGRERSIFDRLLRNSAVLESHVGLWLKQAYWRSLIRGDGLVTRESLRIGLVGNAHQLAADLAAAASHAHILLLSEQDDWKQVNNLHLLIVGDQRYDIRSLQNSRADLLTVAWINESPTQWSSLAWWPDFSAVLAPVKAALRLQAKLNVCVQASAAANPLGTLLDTTKPRMRVCIRFDFSDTKAHLKATALRQKLRLSGLPCWLESDESVSARMADVCVTLTRKTGKPVPVVTVAKAMLHVALTPSAQLPSAAWLESELEKQVGSTFHSP